MYAEECKESDGSECLYTDVTYTTCTSTAEMSEFPIIENMQAAAYYHLNICDFTHTVQDKFCVRLSDGSERCSKREKHCHNYITI